MGRSDIPTGAVAALLVATAPGAPSGVRDLLWRPVLGRPLISWPLRAVTQLATLSACSVLVPQERNADCRDLMLGGPSDSGATVSAIYTGERTWAEMLRHSEGRADWLIVIDATLPLVTTESLRAGLRAALRTGVAIAGEAVKETLKRVDGDTVVETPPRGALRRLLTPIIFQRDALRRALNTYDPLRAGANDLVGLTSLTGVALTVYDAGYPGVRVTADADLAIVETLLTQRQSENHSS